MTKSATAILSKIFADVQLQEAHAVGREKVSSDDVDLDREGLDDSSFANIPGAVSRSQSPGIGLGSLGTGGVASSSSLHSASSYARQASSASSLSASSGAHSGKATQDYLMSPPYSTGGRSSGRPPTVPYLGASHSSSGQLGGQGAGVGPGLASAEEEGGLSKPTRLLESHFYDWSR